MEKKNLSFVNNNNTCDGIMTLVDLSWYISFSWWIEGFSQLIVGCFGFFSNCVVISVLCRKKMDSTFNRFLIFLALFDNIFLMCSIGESIQRHFIPTRHYLTYYYFSLYQLKNIALICSIYITLVLSSQRYFAISKPIDYHISNMETNAGGHPWRETLMVVVPIIIFGFIFVFPKFFEFKTQTLFTSGKVWDEETNGWKIQNQSSISYQPSSLRLNKNYSFYYLHLASLIVTGIFPFLTLSILNFCILRLLRCRQVVAPSVQPSSPRCRYQQEIVLFVIVFFFFVNNTPRLIMSIYEVYNLGHRNLDDECFSIPLHVMVMLLISTLLMTINASINFPIYCFTSTTFRERLFEDAKALISGAKTLVCCGQSTSVSLEYGTEDIPLSILPS